MSNVSPTVRDRYELVGLRHNPYVFDDHESDLAAEQFVDRGLPAPPAAGSATLVQVIGDQGAGKTTQVQHWRRVAPGPYHYVPRRPYVQRWSRPPVAPLVYADEIDRMPRALRWHWFRQASRARATIVAGTHVDLTRRAERAGLQVITHHLGPVDPDTLAAIIDQRLATAALQCLCVGTEKSHARKRHERSECGLPQHPCVGTEKSHARKQHERSECGLSGFRFSAADIDQRLATAALQCLCVGTEKSHARKQHERSECGLPRFRFSAADIDQVHTKSNGALRVAEGLCHELLAERVR